MLSGTRKAHTEQELIMNKKRIIRALLLAGVYLVLLYLFTFFENSQGITFAQAIWYSLATLSTVGYGDVVPQSTGGMIIGGLFAMCSTFLFAFVVGVVLSIMRGSLLPMLRLAVSGGKSWYIFEEFTIPSRIMGQNIQRESSKNVVVFANTPSSNNDGKGKSEIYTTLSAESVIRRASDKDRCLVFCMDHNGFSNYQRAASLLDTGARVCCMSEFEPDHYPSSLILFNPYISCASLYWSKYPVRLSGETIVLIGSGKYADAILEQALVVNVLAPNQQIRYIVYGDFEQFRLNHPCLSQICNCSDQLPEHGQKDSSSDQLPAPGQKDPRGDTLVFSSAPWNEDHGVLKTADRIILCFDDEEETLSTFFTLHKYVPTTATIYARLSQDADGAPIRFGRPAQLQAPENSLSQGTSEAVLPQDAPDDALPQETKESLIRFGNPEELLTPEIVLHRHLDKWARTMHEIYLTSSGLTSPRWEELDAFKRRSNCASADHILVKMRILLGEKAGRELTKETLEAAFEQWQKEWPEKKAFFREIEHERWMRFHFMNNWQYNKVRNDAKRLHSSLLPFDSLDEKEQSKDDYAWELLGKLARN